LNYGQPHGQRPFLDSARRRRNQGNGVLNPRIIRLTASDVVAAPDAHPSSTRLGQRLGDAAWTLDKQRSISVQPTDAFELSLLDPKVGGDPGVVAANLLDEPLGILAADERLDRAPSGGSVAPVRRR